MRGCLVLAGVLLIGCGSSGSGSGGGAGSGGMAAASGSGGVGAASGAGGNGATAGTGGSGTGGAGAGGTGAGGAGGSGGTAGSGGTGGAPPCEPGAGTAELDASCDIVRVGVIERSGKQRVELRARITLWDKPTCAVLDEVVLGQQGTLVQTIATGGITLAEDYNALLFETDASPQLVAYCADESQRFEAFGFTAKGRGDGGTFEAKCGPADSGGHWPPAVVLTCHSEIAEQPFAANSMVEDLGPVTTSTISAVFPHAPGQDQLATVDGSVRILPHVYSWGGNPPIPPFDTTGWSTSTSEMTVSGKEMSQLQLHAMQDLLGLELCPVINPQDPMPDPGPVYLAKVTGTTSVGPFASEIFVDICTRVPVSGP